MEDLKYNQEETAKSVFCVYPGEDCVCCNSYNSCIDNVLNYIFGSDD